jgi:hypothetical protein
MSDNIAIFLTVLASSCLGMYFYYNEQNTELDDDANELENSTDLDLDDSKDLKDVDDDGQSYSEEQEQDIYFGKKIRQQKPKSKRNKRSTPKKYVSSRKTYY